VVAAAASAKSRTNRADKTAAKNVKERKFISLKKREDELMSNIRNAAKRWAYK
jgi:hypothetical protein